MDSDSSDSSYCCEELGSFEEQEDSQIDDLEMDEDDQGASDASAILSSLGTF
jgi:hypothetical protein